MNQGYIKGDNSGLRVTDEYIEKFKQLKTIPPGITEEEINIDLQSFLGEAWTAFTNELLKDASLSLKTALKNGLQGKLSNNLLDYIDNELSFSKLFPEKALINFKLNIYNIYLKKLINEFSDEDLKKELREANLALVANSHSENLDFIRKVVERSSQPEKLRQDFNTTRYRLEYDSNMIDKLDRGENNRYLKFLSVSIKYIDDILKYQPNVSTQSKDDNSGLTLKSIFLDPQKYYEVIEKLKMANHIVQHNGTLTFKPKRQGTKYEPEALRQALIILEYIDAKRTFSNFEISTMLSNTFEGYKTTDRTLRSHSIPESIKYYRAILS
jgi:hypothetical protein